MEWFQVSHLANLKNFNMKPIVINIHNLVENLSVTDSVQGRQELEDEITETLNKVIQNAQSQVTPEKIDCSKRAMASDVDRIFNRIQKELIEPAIPQTSIQLTQEKANFFEAAHRLEEYLRRNENSGASENLLKDLFLMKEFSLETIRTNERSQSACNRACTVSRAIHNAQELSLDYGDF